jgi:tripartite-type tricarboxylate transporter receptor subunit TctC
MFPNILCQIKVVELKKNAKRFKFIGAVISMAVIGSFIFLSTQIQAASEWNPEKPIQLIVPYKPGGGSDVLARTIVKAIESRKLSPQPLVVTNMAGGGTTIANNHVSQAKGNTHMLLTYISGQILAPLTVGQTNGTYRDLTMISGLAVDPQVLIAKKGSRFKTIKDVVEESKKNPKSVVMAVGGMGSDDHVLTAMLERAIGVQFRVVSFSGTGDAMPALLGGHVDLVFANPAEFIAQYEGKLVHPIAVAEEKRLAGFPDVPTFKETGLDITYMFFRGLAAPPGIPSATIAFYEKMAKQMSETDVWKDYLKKNMLNSWYKDSKEFTKIVIESEKLFDQTLKDIGLSVR